MTGTYRKEGTATVAALGTTHWLCSRRAKGLILDTFRVMLSHVISLFIIAVDDLVHMTKRARLYCTILHCTDLVRYCPVSPTLQYTDLDCRVKGSRQWTRNSSRIPLFILMPL